MTLLVVVFLNACNTPPPKEKQEEVKPSTEGLFINVSDLHFDPYYDTTLVDTLMKSPYTAWKGIYESSKMKNLSTYQHDSNYPLIKSALEQMKKELASPDYIMISGDFLSHHFEPDFTKYSGISYDTDKANGYMHLHDFNEKTMRFLASLFDEYFPNTPVYSTLGNNDAFCGDYLIQPGASFLTILSDVWKPLLRNENTGTFENTFNKAGYYAIESPFNKNHKIVVLNSILFSINFNDPKYRKAYCDLGDFGPNNEEPGDKQLIWLKAQLEASRSTGEKVWLIQHIPPGMNVFGTIPKDSTECVGDTSSYFLKPVFNNKYLDIVEEYADVITTNMAGYYHRDDFRLIKNAKGEAVSYMHILPAISPIYYNNPGFEIVKYDRESTQLLDYTTYYTDVHDPAQNLQWKKEYNFHETYQQDELNPTTMDAIHKQLQTDKKMAQHYMKYYPVSETETMKDFRFYWCGISNLTPESYQNCLCNQ